MKKIFEYKEPEFKVIKTTAQDVLTASGDITPTPGGSLSTAYNNWNTPIIGF